MQRPAAIEGQVVGDVDQRRDRPKTDGLEAILQPLRGRSVLEAAHHATGKHRAGRIVAVELQRDRHGRGEGAADRRERIGLQLAEAARREIAGNAANAEAVGPVGGDGDIDHRVGAAAIIGERHADRSVLGQLDDAIVLVGKPELALRAHHAAALYAANGADLEHVTGGRNDDAGQREHALEAGACVGGATHHLHRPLAGIDRQQLQLVGVGVLVGGDDLGDDERLERRRRIGNVLHLEAHHGERLDDFVERGFRFEMVFQPAESELHDAVLCRVGSYSS